MLKFCRGCSVLLPVRICACFLCFLGGGGLGRQRLRLDDGQILHLICVRLKYLVFLLEGRGSVLPVFTAITSILDIFFAISTRESPKISEHVTIWRSLTDLLAVLRRLKSERPVLACWEVKITPNKPRKKVLGIPGK